MIVNVCFLWQGHRLSPPGPLKLASSPMQTDTTTYSSEKCKFVWVQLWLKWQYSQPETVFQTKKYISKNRQSIFYWAEYLYQLIKRMLCS